ncbi:MAG: LysR family transcriptional regulator [Chloroflexi bacterium]|nr:LysR family transcriptional regulator [Chloroflexota bacterium]
MEQKSKFWIEKDGQLVLSDWRVDLLEAIGETGSIARAAERLSIGYRRAWGKIKEMEERLGVKLVDGQSGGVGGGGAQLTPVARKYIQMYRRFSVGLKQMVDQKFREAFGEEG